jgi:hypothetical protein
MAEERGSRTAHVVALIGIVASAAVGLWVWAWPAQRICSPNESKGCACPEGASGQQTCLADGRGYSSCACPSPSERPASLPAPVAAPSADVETTALENELKRAKDAISMADHVAGENKSEPTENLRAASKRRAVDPSKECKESILAITHPDGVEPSRANGICATLAKSASAKRGNETFMRWEVVVEGGTYGCYCWRK